MLETMKRILTMAGKYRHKVTIGIIISLLHSFFSAMDLFAILYISFSINTLTQQKIGVAAAILLVGLTGKIICKYQITEHISGSSYDVFYEKRLEAGEKLKRVPMGYFSEKNLGEIQMAMTTDMNALESSAMSVTRLMFYLERGLTLGFWTMFLILKTIRRQWKSLRNWWLICPIILKRKLSCDTKLICFINWLVGILRISWHP